MGTDAQATLPTLLKAAADFGDYTLVVTGHSLGGCTAQTVALALRQEGRKLAATAGTRDAGAQVAAAAAAAAAA